MGRLVGSEGTNSEKHTLSVYFATATDGYLPWNRDIFLVEDNQVFFSLQIDRRGLKILRIKFLANSDEN